MSVLEELAAASRKRAEGLLQQTTLDELYESAVASPKRDFAGALAAPGLAVISEIKRASPSAGFIREVDVAGWAKRYQDEGASCLSVLTEPGGFMGSLEDLDAARNATRLPALRKDFTVDEAQVLQAGARADAVLLIVAILDGGTLARYLSLAREVGLCAIVEVHDDKELEVALEAGARIIGVNNRNLKDFSVDLATTERLAERVTDEILVAESGIKSAEDGRRLRDCGADAVLVGEAAMRDPSLVGELSKLP